MPIGCYGLEQGFLWNFFNFFGRVTNNLLKLRIRLWDQLHDHIVRRWPILFKERWRLWQLQRITFSLASEHFSIFGGSADATFLSALLVNELLERNIASPFLTIVKLWVLRLTCSVITATIGALQNILLHYRSRSIVEQSKYLFSVFAAEQARIKTVFYLLVQVLLRRGRTLWPDLTFLHRHSRFERILDAKRCIDDEFLNFTRPWRIRLIT